MNIDFRNLFKLSVLLLFFLSLSACDNGSSSSSGGGQKEAAPVLLAPIGPDLNGDTWQGYLKDLHGNFTPVTAIISHSGNDIIIDTSLPDTILAGRLEGRISSQGGLLLIDSSDGEDWTTLYGPASANSINLADFVFAEGSNVDTNILILKR